MVVSWKEPHVDYTFFLKAVFTSPEIFFIDVIAGNEEQTQFGEGFLHSEKNQLLSAIALSERMTYENNRLTFITSHIYGSRHGSRRVFSASLPKLLE